MKKFLRIIAWILLPILLLCGGLTLSLRIPAVQNYIVQKATGYLSRKLATRVEIKSFGWSLFRNVDLRGFYLADKKGDTLIYAGTLNADISYWSLVKRQIKIKGITLEDARIRLVNDTSGALNLTTLFSSDPRSPVIKVKPAIDTTSKPLNLLVEIENLSVSNTDFRFEDQKKHLLVNVFIPVCEIKLNQMALQKKLIDIHSVFIDGVRSAVTVEMKDENTPPPPMELFRFLPPGWEIKWDQIAILHSVFAYNDVNKPVKKKGVDFAHIALTDINLRTKKGDILRDSINADISSLAALEKSGFEIKKLGALATVSIHEISLRDLNLETANSKLNSYMSFSYSDFEDFNDFASKVSFKAEMHDAALSLRDLNYFLGFLDPVAHNTIRISGRIAGRLNSLDGKDIVLSTGSRTYLRGSFYANGLPNIMETSLNLKVEMLETSASDIQHIYSTDLYPPGFSTLGNIRTYGDFDGFLTDFVTRGTLITDIGSGTSDLNFKYNRQTGKSAYTGNISLDEFDLGKWFGDQATFGKVSLRTSIEGGGIKLETLNAKLLGDISNLTIKGYDYKEMKVDGLVKGKFFSGDLVVKDKYLDADFTGTVDLQGRIPRYNFAASVRNVNFRELHLTKDTFNMRGNVAADFSGRKPDDMVGSVLLNNIFMQHGHDSVTVKNITATSSILEGARKEITLKTDNIDGEITGQFSFSGLPKALKRYLNYTFTKNYEDSSYIQPQQFAFELHFFDSSGITRILDTRFAEIRNSVIKGELNTVDHVFNFSGTIPEIVFDKYTMKNFEINGRSKKGKIDVTAIADKIYAGDSLLVDTLVSHSYSEGDEFRFDLLTADAKKHNSANITAYLKPLKSGAEVRFLPSEVWLGGNKWSFAPDNRITIQGKKIITDSVIFSSGVQSLKFSSYLKNDTSTSINLAISQTSLSDFVNIFQLKIGDIKATVNGTISVDDVFAKPAPIANIEIKDLYLGKIPLGVIRVNSTLDEIEKKININASVTGEQNNIAIKGFYDLVTNEINLDNDITAINLNFLNHKLFVKYVRAVTGTVAARLALHGPLKALVLTGNLHINEAKVTVSYLNTSYTLHDQDVEVGDGYFDLGSTEVRDSFNNKAIGTGRIYHDHFRKITMDLHVVTDKIRILNTTAKDVPVFYGNGFVKGTMDFTGTLPQVTIRANAQVKPGTHCYIPISNTYETNKYSFYHFVNPKKDTVIVRRKEDIKLTGVNFILTLDVNPDGILDILLDPGAGDILTSRGRGELKVEILRSGEFNIYGRYEIEQGSYLFTMQNIVNKNFVLDPGGTIIFRGDVYNAQLDVDAVYKVKTSTYDLISDQLAANGVQSSSSIAAQALNRIEVDLLLKLKGVLQSPEVSFDIKPINPDVQIRSYVDAKMQILNSNEAELNKQVFGLLVMNRFLPTGATPGADPLTNGTSIGNSAFNTVSEFLSSQFSFYMGSLFDNLNVKDLDLNFNFKQYDQSLTTSNLTYTDQLNIRRELQLALTKKFLNNRLSVNVGGNLDFGDNNAYTAVPTTTSKQSTYGTSDFELEYVLDKNGTWRAKTYNRYDYDYFLAKNINKTGIGLSFRQDFDNWADLFKRRAKKPKLEVLPQPTPKPEQSPKAPEK